MKPRYFNMVLKQNGNRSKGKDKSGEPTQRFDI